MTILLASLAVLLPILTLPFWFFYFDITPKVVVLVMGAAAACVMTAWNAVPLRDLWRNKMGRRVILMLCLQAAALLLAAASSSSPELSMWGSNWRCFGVVTEMALYVLGLLTVCFVVARPASLKWVLRSIAVSGAIIAVYAILQYSGWDPLLPAATYHIGEGEWMIVRPPGTIGHADYLGSYLVFVVFLSGALISMETGGVWRALGIGAAMGGSFAVVLSGTRSAMLGILIGVLLLGWKRGANWKRMGIAVVLCTVALGSFYYSPWGLKMRSRGRWMREDAAGGARPLLWRDSLWMARARWWTGWGPETFPTAFPVYQSLELARAYPDFYHESPHNVFLDELVGKGAAGFLAFLAWSAAAAWAGWRALRGPYAYLGAALLAGLVSLEFNAFVATTAFFFYLTAAMVLALEIVPDGNVETPAGRGLRWGMGFGGALMAVVFVVFGVKLLVGDVVLARVRTQLEAGNVVGAAGLYETVRRWEGRPGSSDLYYSRNMAANVRRQPQLLLSVKALQEAVQAGIRATRSAEDRQNAAYHLASVYAQMNNHQEAGKYLRMAAEAAPNWFKPHWMLAQVLAAEGRVEEARVEAVKAVERDGGKHEEVTATWRKLER